MKKEFMVRWNGGNFSSALTERFVVEAESKDIADRKAVELMDKETKGYVVYCGMTEIPWYFPVIAIGIPISMTLIFFAMAVSLLAMIFLKLS